MPQLPSGLRFALDVGRLQKLVEDASSAKWVHDLMAIEQGEHLFPYIDILMLRPADEDKVSQVLCEGSLPLPEALEPFPSGHHLGNADLLTSTWSEEDRQAFKACLHEARFRVFLQSQLELVEKAKAKLLAEPSTTAGLLATYWKLGCHPLQDGQDLKLKFGDN